jgi:hypothetical protein
MTTEGMHMTADIRGGLVSEWLVTGWFTPSYRPLAEKFAANLAENGAPFHLWAKPSAGTWNTRRKPAVVLEAMDAYPDKTVILMDVDCLIRGDVAPLAEVAGDVGICAIARDVKKGDATKHWLAFETSSRVMVFRPTEAARRFAERWAEVIATSAVNHDEHSLSWAFLRSPDVRFDYLDQAYSGREVSLYPDAVVAHDSAHEKQRRDDMSPVKRFLRIVEKPFRTGKTKAGKLRGELSVLLKA